MTLDGQVLLIAFLAMSLKLILWAAEHDTVSQPQSGAPPTNSKRLRYTLDSTLD
jgi:hypothetical protein